MGRRGPLGRQGQDYRAPEIVGKGMTRPGVCREEGFSLLEVMVALAILGMALVAIFGLFSGGLAAAKLVKDYDQALFYAQQKMEELNLSPTLRPDVERGEFGESGYRWVTEVSSFSDNGWEDDGDSPIKLVQVQVKVSWPGRQRERTLELNTLKMIVDQQD